MKNTKFVLTRGDARKDERAVRPDHCTGDQIGNHVQVAIDIGMDGIRQRPASRLVHFDDAGVARGRLNGRHGLEAFGSQKVREAISIHDSKLTLRTGHDRPGQQVTSIEGPVAPASKWPLAREDDGYFTPEVDEARHDLNESVRLLAVICEQPAGRTRFADGEARGWP
jgi:hypothetical protein